MSWSPLPPRRYSANSPATPAVTAAIGLGRVNAPQPRLIMVFRPASIPDAPAWLKAGNRVGVMVGHGEHRGAVRVVPGVDFTLGKTGGRNVGDAVMLFVPLPPTLEKVARNSSVAGLEWQDDWVEVTLPRAWWHDPEATKPAPVQSRPYVLGSATSRGGR